MNGDSHYTQGLQAPLFYITNIGKHDANKVYISGNHIYIPTGTTKLYECKYQNFMHLDSVFFNKIEISNLILSGSSLALTDSENINTNTSSRIPLLKFHRVCNVHINNNKFQNIGNERAIWFSGDILGYEDVNSISHEVCNNKMLNSYGFFLETQDTKDILIQNNETNNTGIFFKFGGVIELVAINFLVKRNTIKNFSYAGIRTGDYLEKDPKYVIKNSGIIEENTIYYDDSYKEHYSRHTIMDGGAIYFYSHNDPVTCQNNVIYNYKGRKDYRGIFGDNGAYGITLRGNLVFKVDDYSIESYYFNEFYKKSFSNILENNILLGSYKFEGNPFFQTDAIKSYKKGNNYINDIPVLRNVQESSSDIYDPLAKGDKDMVVLYKDTTGLNIHPFIAERIVTCNDFLLNKDPIFSSSNSFLRLDTNSFQGSGYTYPSQNNYIQIANGSNSYKWTKSYKLNEDIQLNVNNRIEVIDTKFAIIGEPKESDEFYTSNYGAILKTFNGISWSYYFSNSINPIKKGIDEKRYVIQGNNTFQTQYISSKEFKGITFETLNTTKLFLGVEIKYRIKGGSGEIFTIYKSFPIKESLLTGSYSTFIPKNQDQINFQLSNYWLADALTINTQSTAVYKASSIIMQSGFIGKPGFQAISKIAKLETGNTVFNKFIDCTGSYFVTSQYSPINSYLSTDIKESSTTDILLYPNPSNGILFMKDFGSDTRCCIKIYDTSGKLVYLDKDVQKGSQINLTSFPKGMYLVIINNDEDNFMEKIILK
jgi:hypothetical protein